MKIYIDIGNTNIKFNIVKNEVDYYISYPTTYFYTVDTLYSILPDTIKNDIVEKVWICSVVPKMTKIAIGLSKKYFNVIPNIVDKGIKTGIKLQVDDPKTLGSDLVALASYANKIATNVIIINAGTATTIIHVKDSILKGAIIMPGIENQLSGFIKSAARISEVSIKYSMTKIGKNTEDSLSIGIVNSHIYAIERHVSNIDKDAIVILSGGNRKYIEDHVNYKSVKEATIQGMKVIGELNDI